MLIPSIDLQDGQAVQLVQGRRLAIEAGDPRPLLEKFSRVGEVAVIDLDAARGVGDNRELISELVAMAPCRVGGGIRDLDIERRQQVARLRVRHFTNQEATGHALDQCLARFGINACQDGVVGLIEVEKTVVQQR